MPPKLQTITNLNGPSGRLEALLNTGDGNAPFAVLLCHPHPPSGGSMHNKVVFHAMKAFTSLGLPVLRFNFRSVGLSDGEYDRGIGEREDVLAALNWLDYHLHLPILSAGFSFGAAVALHAAHNDHRIKALIAIGLPINVALDGATLRSYTYPFLANCPLPKLFLLGDHDRYAPIHDLETIFTAAAPPKRLIWVPEADHFFAGTPNSPTSKLPAMQSALREWLLENFPENFS